MNRRTVLAAGVAAVAGCADVAAPQRPDADAAETQIIEGINEVRADAGVGELPTSDELAAVARDHSADMAERDYYAHRSPDGVGVQARLPCRGSENLHRGEIGLIENIDSERSWNTRETDELAGYVVEGWRLSDGHRRNMLDTRWSAVGVGVHVGDAEFFATANFC
jgi:uncharacterized protein YkwD